jgi:hypothetical protein
MYTVINTLHNPTHSHLVTNDVLDEVHPAARPSAIAMAATFPTLIYAGVYSKGEPEALTGRHTYHN